MSEITVELARQLLELGKQFRLRQIQLDGFVAVFPDEPLLPSSFPDLSVPAGTPPKKVVDPDWPDLEQERVQDELERFRLRTAGFEA